MKINPNKKKIGKWFVAAGMVLFLSLLFLLNLRIGSTNMNWSEIWAAMTEKGNEEAASVILWEIRLPRMMAAMVLGGALAVSGYLLQTFFDNPIAGPFILGISSGAKLVVAMAMVYSLSVGRYLSSWWMVAVAFGGAMISMGFVLVVSGSVHNMTALIICGVMIGYICSAITDFLVTFADDSNIVNLHNWSLGSFAGTSLSQVPTMCVIVFPAVAAAMLLSKQIGVYRMGEAYAASVGMHIRLFRMLLLLLSGLLAACVTAFAGPISFVGVAVPHLMRSLFKTSKPAVLLPISFLGGSIFCLGCDLLARSLFSPMELSISSVTALFGAPVVIHIMLFRNKNKQNE